VKGSLDILEGEALRDFEAILKQSLMFGADATDRLRHRLLAHFERIARGFLLGHARPDIPMATPAAFLLVRPTHYLIVYNPDTRRVIRILDGRRDLVRLLS
jgi:plasmid stabilization system protein ParE